MHKKKNNKKNYLLISKDVKKLFFFIGGHSTFFGLLNTFVHIVMYTYYLFAAMGPQYQRFLWWKKYLTALQMVSNSHIVDY